jgi:hypothetical protein
VGHEAALGTVYTHHTRGEHVNTPIDGNALVNAKILEALKQTNGDSIEAERLFRVWLNEDPALFEALIRLAVDRVVIEAFRSVMQRIKKGQMPESGDLTIKPRPRQRPSARGEKMGQSPTQIMLDEYTTAEGLPRIPEDDATNEEITRAMLHRARRQREETAERVKKRTRPTPDRSQQNNTASDDGTSE